LVLISISKVNNKND